MGEPRRMERTIVERWTEEVLFAKNKWDGDIEDPDGSEWHCRFVMGILNMVHTKFPSRLGIPIPFLYIGGLSFFFCIKMTSRFELRNSLVRTNSNDLVLLRSNFDTFEIRSIQFSNLTELQ